MIPGIPAPYILAGLFIAGVLSGGYGTHTWYKAQRVDAVETARTDERHLQKGANQASVRHADALLEQEQTAAKNEKDFRRVLNEKNRELANCRVDAELIGVLDDAARMPGAARDPGEPRPGPAAAVPAPDSTCEAELGICRANYADVCVPNALQLRDLQGFTRGLIRDYNRAIGRE